MPSRGMRFVVPVQLFALTLGVGGYAQPLDLDPEDLSPEAILLELQARAFQENPAFLSQRLQPLIQQAEEALAVSIFDPAVEAQAHYSEVSETRLARSGGGREFEDSDSFLASAALTRLFPTGTRISAGVEMETERSSLYNNPITETRVGIDIDQPLLQGFGRNSNLVRLRQSRIDTALSWFELKGFALAVALEVEDSFWRYLLATEEVKVLQQNLHLNQQRLEDTQQRVESGAAARLELPAVEADAARARELLVIARADVEKTQIALKRLTGVETLPEALELPAVGTSPEMEPVDIHLGRAMRFRPDLAQARYAIERRELEVVAAGNGLLPRLDFFASLGLSGYGESRRQSAREISDDMYDFQVGAVFRYPLGNRAAKANRDAAVFSVRAALHALENYRLLIAQDVISAWVDVRAARERVETVEDSVVFARAAYDAEEQRLANGLSTSFQVSQALQVRLEAELRLVEARIGVRRAEARLNAAEGTLLERRGIMIADFPSELVETRDSARRR